ncbi:MAG: glucose-1-phosphate adenylyltransferase, partial [Candidatus Eisenbacteria bacterium]|nr:glucose-1-phosphate adenylyltransferase [Candidatus Eisenbacteria bacterium]
MKKVMAFVFAGVRTEGLSVLTSSRSVAAVPFAGKYRLIDFTLSNCVNSELYRVAILAQTSPHSLIKHVGRGEPWDLDRRGGGVQIL